MPHNQHHYLSKTPTLMPIRSHSPPLPSPGSTRVFPVSLDLPVLDISCKRNHTVCGLSCLASFPGHHGVKVHHFAASVRRPSFFRLNNIPSRGWATLCCPSVSLFGCFRSVAVVTRLLRDSGTRFCLNTVSSLGCIFQEGHPWVTR